MKITTQKNKKTPSGGRLSNNDSNSFTRECIHGAMIYLAQNKPFDKITITELAKKAGVSRTAFYRNYTSKEDVLQEIANNIGERLWDAADKLKYATDPYRLYFECFYWLEKFAPTITMLIKADLVALFTVKIGSFLEEIHPVSSVENHYTLLALEGAFLKIALNWLNDGMKETKEYMADLCVRIINKGERELSTIHT